MFLELSEMYRNAEEWDKSVPADLITAIKALRESFDEAHWKCGHLTQILCFFKLHPSDMDDEVKEQMGPLLQLKAVVGPAATQRFHHLLKEGTPPAIFKAFYDLYLDGTTVQILAIFHALAEIGRATRSGWLHHTWNGLKRKQSI